MKEGNGCVSPEKDDVAWLIKGGGTTCVLTCVQGGN